MKKTKPKKNKKDYNKPLAEKIGNIVGHWNKKVVNK